MGWDPSGSTRIAKNVFRLLRLVPEVQNDVEIVKPVLQELEVMRLTCALGVLPSVNAKDFDFDMLEAHELDEQFALLLRRMVFGNESTNNEEIKLLCLFGKHDEVKSELVRLGEWSDNCDENLLVKDQGIYCVHKTEENSKQSALILFSWLEDELFEAQRIRDTATYILRFLTCLSSHVVCCLSETGITRIQEAVVSLSASKLDACQSYSVAFHVERQEDERDAVLCQVLKTTLLPTEAANATYVDIVKGSFPAVVFVKQAPAIKSAEQFKQKFVNSENLVQWVVEQAPQYNLTLDNGLSWNVDWRNSLLQVTGFWPADKLTAIEEIRCRSTRDASSFEEVGVYISEQRLNVVAVQDVLFTVDVLFDSTEKDDAIAYVKALLNELRRDADISDEIGNKAFKLLAIPLKLNDHMEHMQSLYASSKESELNALLGKLKSGRSIETHKESKLKALASWFLPSAFSQSEEDLFKFRERMAIPLQEMKANWLDNVQKTFDIYHDSITLKKARDSKQSIDTACGEDISSALSEAFQELQNHMRHREHSDLVMRIEVREVAKRIVCEVKREKWNPAALQVHIFKDTDKHEGMKSLGIYTLQHNASLLRVFTVKSHCVLVVTNIDAGTQVEKVQFSPDQMSSRRTSQSCTKIRGFGRSASLCDFNVQNRLMALVDESGSIALYRFDENFKAMEWIRKIDMTTHSTLSLPLVDVLVLDEIIFGVDHIGAAQSINLCSQQMSPKIQPSNADIEAENWSSPLFSLLDGLALGKTNIQKGMDPFQGEFSVVSSEDHRLIPVSFSGTIQLHSATAVSVQSFGNLIYVLDTLGNSVHVIQADITIRSDSYRIRQSTSFTRDNESQEDVSAENMSKFHWLWVLYHMYEKYPVNGLLSRRSDRDALTVTLRCASNFLSEHKIACKMYVRHIMDSLRKLNKSLSGLNLEETLSFRPDNVVLRDIDDFDTVSIRKFVWDVVTFVPVQICRAEENMLTVLTNGQSTLVKTSSDQTQTFQAADIAESMRFGLLSPLLNSWDGRCIVVTSMGKQSTGKSYFLNHLTGTSFAIARARCTDGAWMAVQVLSNDVLLVVLDFEGLGSFERTEQEDVFLSVLNASLSMFTIFRMEMRLDKEIDDLFTKFQKGVQLIKNDSRLFSGKLYMSVKDVNSNDQKGVLDEFVAKFGRLIQANREQNFLSDLYKGQLGINCSPPLGTFGYYRSLAAAQKEVELLIDDDLRKGFSSGKMFLDCLRLVLRKFRFWTGLHWIVASSN